MYAFYQPRISVAQEEANIQSYIDDEYQRGKQEENDYYQSLEDDYYKHLEQQEN